MNIAGVKINFRTFDPTLERLSPEIESQYDFDSIPFEHGDVVVDVGAHRGGVALYLAKRYPVRVLAFEPEPENFAELEWAVKHNRLKGIVRPYNKAVTADGRDLEIHYGTHSGEHSAWLGSAPARGSFTARSTTLNAIFRKHRIKRCKLLKLDCEGAEHEILEVAATSDLLARVDNVRGELHMTRALRELGYDIATTGALVDHDARWMEVTAA